MVDWVTKGSNIHTEHYSAVQADVPDPDDPTTHINTGLIKTLMDADDILVAGEALSHCLAFTASDIADNFGDDSLVSKFILLTDATNSVPGFEQNGVDFITRLTARGMRTTTTKEYLA